MDLINDKLSKIYLKYLTAAFGSAFMGSVFGLVDMVMVGQYHGPEGSAAMGVIAPVWNIVYSFGLLAGIGGCFDFYTTARAKSAQASALTPTARQQKP